MNRGYVTCTKDKTNNRKHWAAGEGGRRNDCIDLNIQVAILLGTKLGTMADSTLIGRMGHGKDRKGGPRKTRKALLRANCTL